MTAPGSVYFIEAVGADAIKIGWALKPERRLKLLAIGCPLELRLLATVPGSLGHEGALQTRFATQCVRGEWYRRNPELEALIAHAVSVGTLPTDVVPQPRTDISERPGIEPLLRCVAVAGTQSAVARALGTTPANVSNVVQQGRRIPPHWCLKLQAETLRLGQPVWCDELRPDLYPPEDHQYMHPIRQRQLRPDLYPTPQAQRAS